MQCFPHTITTFTHLPRGRVVAIGGIVLGAVRLPADSIGSFYLTLTNLVDGSSVQIEPQDGSTTLHNSVVSGTSESITLPVYASGSPFNTLRIKVRKGTTAPKQLPYETLATATVGSQSVFVAQIPDLIA